MALSVNDMGKIVFYLKTAPFTVPEGTKAPDGLSIMHDPGAKSDSAGAVKKFFNLNSPKGTKAGCLLSISMVSGGETLRHTVPLTGDEVLVLSTLLQSAIPSALNW